MRIYNSIEEFKKVENAVVTIGTFDGVHIGHQKIIEQLKSAATQINGQVVVLTFFPHPRMVLYPDDHGLQLLNTLEEKKTLLQKAGIDHLIIHPFSREFSRLNATEFVRDILVSKLGVKKLIIGYDHHFGRNREGGIYALRDLAPVFNFEIEQIPEQDINDVAVSSTKIRNALLSGDVSTANLFLGYQYELTGKVVAGNKIGKQIGFPTANVGEIENYKLIPANGIYAVQVHLDSDADPNEKNKVYHGALSIGTRPTFDNGARTVEVYILDFDKEIYGRNISIHFVERIRNELKFDSVALLIERIRQDVVLVRNIFKKNDLN